MTDPFDPVLAANGIVLLDGGLATELERRGADLRDPLWSARVLLEQPELIREVHLDYFRAGADIATTASYQATLPGLARRGLDAAQSREVLRLSVRLACEARTQFQNEGARSRPLVAASVGCYGAFRHDGSEYRGDYGLSPQALRDWHRPRVEILAESGADLLAFETIPCLVEAEAIVQLLEEMPGVRAWISFSCRDESHLCHGETFADAAALVDACDAARAVGVNCTAPRHIEGLLYAARGRTQKLLAAYPNSGESWDPVRHCWTVGETSANWGLAARSWRDAGASLIGGCCRTTPATIAELAGALRPPAASRSQ